VATVYEPIHFIIWVWAQRSHKESVLRRGFPPSYIIYFGSIACQCGTKSPALWLQLRQLHKWLHLRQRTLQVVLLCPCDSLDFYMWFGHL